MSDSEIPDINKKIASNNYLSNCYKYLIREKIIHFLLIIIEILLNTIQELDIIFRDYNPINQKEKSSILSFILSFVIIVNDRIPKIYKLLIITTIAIVFDSIYLFLKRNNFVNKKYIYISIIVNFLELFYFRAISLIFFDLFYSFENLYLGISILLSIPHIYLIVNNFFFNHLYYYVPAFIDYPYDEFSFTFDISLLITKIFLAIISSSNNEWIGGLCFIMLFIIQIFYIFYFGNQLINHSHLFMKNTFLNKTRVSFYISQFLIIFYAMISERKQIKNILFIVACIILLLIIMGYFFCLYNPFLFIEIKKETPMKNIVFYLHSISKENKLSFLIKHKINDHYQKCGYCSLCKKYIYYLKKGKKNEVVIDIEEKQSLINNENIKNNDKIKNELKDLFFVLDAINIKYFNFIKNLVKVYNLYGKESLNNYAHYYINLSFLIYSENSKKNLNLLLNEKLILEFIHQQNSLLLDDNRPRVIQIFLCDKFMTLSNKIINKMKKILISERKLQKAQEIMNLSFMLKEMENKEYKNNIFNNKAETLSKYNFKNMITICSIIYEEIFNKSLNNSNIPIRENIQPLEDIFCNNKQNKLISLSVNLINEKCKIIRIGKDLSDHVNHNLFDLFPLIFKDYQTKLFLSSILDNFDENINNQENINENINNYNNKLTKKTTIQASIKKINKKKNDSFVDIKLIICKNISSKVFYKYLSLRLTPLFNNDCKYYILFDGVYTLHKKTIITEYQTDKIYEKLLSVSEPDLEKNNETYKISLKKYNLWLNNRGYNISKVFSFNISFKRYIIYELEKRKKKINKKDTLKSTKINKKENSSEEDSSINEELKEEKIKLEDNKSVGSQMESIQNNKKISGIKARNKNKEKFQEYNKLVRISKIIHPFIIVISLLIIIEYFHLNSYYNKIFNYNDTFIKFRKFSKYYFQLFSLTLSISCIYKDINECRNILSYYSDIYFKQYPKETFNITLLLIIHSQRIVDKMMDKKGYTKEINELLGHKKFNEVFGRTLNYYHITQTYIENRIQYEIYTVQNKFSESLLMLCNSFNEIILKLDINTVIYFINKEEKPFEYHNQIINRELTDFEKQIYDMILNYKTYSSEFDITNIRLQNILIETSSIFKIIIYFYLNLNIVMILLIIFFAYAYINFFEIIIVKVLNYINMTINMKTDDFNFNELFSQKLKNLDIILHSYNIDILRAINNLNKIYSQYQRIEMKKMKNEKMKMNKGAYINYENKENKEDDKYKNIPKSQIIINKSQIGQLKVTSKYYIIIFFVIIMTISLYIVILILWLIYFNIETNLFILINKNTGLESAIYRSINIYYIMIFNNYTFSEVSQKIYPDLYDPKESLSTIKFFYSNIYSAFNSQKEKNILGDLYSDKDISNFTCDNLYALNKKILKELDATTSGPKLSSIKKKLIKMCENSGITELNDPKIEFERHFQYIKNDIISFDDFSYDGIVKHLQTGNLGKISLLFNNIMQYLLEMYITKVDKNTINGVCAVMKRNILIMELLFISINIVFVILIIKFVISKIENFSKQIILIINVFKIIEIQE